MSEALDLIKARERTHKPEPAAAERLQEVILAPLIGPSGIGKSTQITEIVKNEADFGRVKSFTDRKRRPEESFDQYWWLPSNSDTHQALLQRIYDGEIVQYTVHPATGKIYGSEISAYNKPFMMLDALSTAIKRLRTLPLKGLVEISLALPYEEWKRRSTKRFTQLGPKEALQRMQEGVQTLSWSLEQGKSMIWVYNSELTKTSKEIIGLARGELEPNPLNRRIGAQLLRGIQADLDR